MNKFIFGSVALAALALSMPANAQSAYFGYGDGPGYARPYDGGYRSYDGDRQYRDGGYRRNYRPYAGDYRTCTVTRVWVGDHYRRIRRCF